MEQLLLWPEGPRLIQAPHAKLTTDTVLLADFAYPGKKETGIDLGCASGALMLLLMWGRPELRMTGVEILEEAARYARETMRLNGLSCRAEILCGDFREKAKQLPNGGFDFVISNPPYYPPERGIRSPDRERDGARAEENCSLEELCRSAGRLCRSGGKIFFSYRPERLTELLSVMSSCRLEPKRLRLVYHDERHPASLALIEGRKDGGPGIAVEAPLLLFRTDGTETDEYRRIYRKA